MPHRYPLSNSAMLLWCLLLVLPLATVLVDGAPRRPHGTRSLADAEAELRAAGGDAVSLIAEPMENIIDLRTDYFHRYLKPIRFRRGRERYWLVLFYASWCGGACDEFYEPLQVVADRLHEKDIAEEEAQMRDKQVMRVRLVNRGKLSIGKHDATLDDGIPAAYGVKDHRSYPALVLFDRDDERKVTHYEGPPNADQIAAFIRDHTNGDVDLNKS